MSEEVNLFEKPETKEMYLVAGWRQWADAGSVSSGLPQYYIQQLQARPIGSISSDGLYLFQIPGTHDLVRPVVRFHDGYPEMLESRRNEFFYSGDEQRGLVIFIGDEPHLDIDRYVSAFLNTAQVLGVKRIIGLGGVYGEMPYDKERMVSGIYSLPQLKDEVSQYAVNLSDYEGGASIGSYVCQKAGERGMEYIGFYAFVPAYTLSDREETSNSIRLENDFTAWLGISRRINHILKIGLDLTDLEQKSQQLTDLVDTNVDEMDRAAPELGVRDYLKRLSEDFTETPFNPLDEIWENELKRLLDKFDPDDPPK